MKKGKSNISNRELIKFLSFSFFIVLTLLPIIYVYVSNFSFDNYFLILKDRRQQENFLRTVKLGFGVMFLSIFFGVTAALLLEYCDLPLRNYLRILLIIPLLIPPYITTISWLMFLGKAGDFVERWEPIPGRSVMPSSQNNIVNIQSQNIQFQKRERTKYLPFDFDLDVYNLKFAIIFLSLSLFPIIFLITSMALRNLDLRLEEAARLLYPQKIVLRKITLPLILPHVIASGLFVFIFAVSELGVVSALRVFTINMEVFAHFSAFFDLDQALGISFPLVILIAIIILLFHFSLGKKEFFTLTSFSREKRMIKLTRLQKILGISFIISLLIFSTIIPLFVLIVESKFMLIESFLKAKKPFINTIFLGILSATLMTLLSFFVAYFSDRKFDPLIFSPLIVPSSAVGIGLIALWNRPIIEAIYGSFFILVIGYLGRFLPFTIKTLTPFFKQIHPNLEESARTLGASFLMIVKKILFPLMKHGLIVAWMVGFILCLRELSISVLVTPAGFQTLANRIFTLYHYGEMESVASLSLILVLIILIPFFLFTLFFHSSKRRIN